MGDFTIRFDSNFLESLSDHIGQYTFSTTTEENHYPNTNLSHFTEFFLSNELAIVSTMRPPSALQTYYLLWNRRWTAALVPYSGHTHTHSWATSFAKLSMFYLLSSRHLSSASPPFPSFHHAQAYEFRSSHQTWHGRRRPHWFIFHVQLPAFLRSFFNCWPQTIPRRASMLLAVESYHRSAKWLPVGTGSIDFFHPEKGIINILGLFAHAESI